jgi:hypothetical protein
LGVYVSRILNGPKPANLDEIVAWQEQVNGRGRGRLGAIPQFSHPVARRERYQLLLLYLESNKAVICCGANGR